MNMEFTKQETDAICSAIYYILGEAELDMHTFYRVCQQFGVNGIDFSFMTQWDIATTLNYMPFDKKTVAKEAIAFAYLTAMRFCSDMSKIDDFYDSLGIEENNY